MIVLLLMGGPGDDTRHTIAHMFAAVLNLKVWYSRGFTIVAAAPGDFNGHNDLCVLIREGPDTIDLHGRVATIHPRLTPRSQFERVLKIVTEFR